MGDFTKLAVWRKAHELARSIYEETSRWPKHELFGLTSQARRAAVSIPAYIAEGCGKNSDAELARHARVSMGSGSELSYYLILAHDLATCRVLAATSDRTRCPRSAACSPPSNASRPPRPSVYRPEQNCIASRWSLPRQIAVKLMADKLTADG